MGGSEKRTTRLTRRSLLKSAAGGFLGSALGPAGRAHGLPDEVPSIPTAAEVDWTPVEPPPDRIIRTWLGPAYWANRLQDWRLHQGRLECLTGEQGDEVRTVAILTRQMVPGESSAHLRVRAEILAPGAGGGFCGFLVGAGAGHLDYRAAALVQKASGIGGGLLCTYETDGQVRFREHTSEQRPHAYSELPSEPPSELMEAGVPDRPGAPQVELRLDLAPQGRRRFELTLSAWNFQTGEILAARRRRDVPEAEILGGIALVSSRYGPGRGARYGFWDLKTGGKKITIHAERSLGPILGTLHSLDGKVLKISAQFMPLGEDEPQSAQFQYRRPGGAWQDGPVETLAPGFTALFRLEDWDATRDWEYRIAYPAGSSPAEFYRGMIRRDPGTTEALKIALFSCAICSARSLEGGQGKPEMPPAELLGRYTDKSLYFPHATMVRHARQHNPHLLVFAGDQLYEASPTRRDDSLSPTLDYLYKWYLWMWSFREMTRDTAAVILTDDHDVYHGNLWGNGGRLAPERDPNRGGYRCTGEFVNVVQRTQCGHNPDAYDATPIGQGISVYYGSFRYGGVSFAVLEDRKFKTAALQGSDLDVHEAELLGARQEKFLAAWAEERRDVSAKICLTQTVFACVQTSPAGRPLLDFDSNGYPKLGRDRAIQLLRAARALVLAGDQHLATLVRHGVESFTDGVVQFTGPAAGSTWQRWFEPAAPAANAATRPSTGDFKDAFGNKVRVLAVANPKVSFREYRRYRRGRSQTLGDRRLKSEGYGIIRVHHESREIVLECWPWNVDPAARGARQFPGWPFTLRFEQMVQG